MSESGGEHARDHEQGIKKNRPAEGVSTNRLSFAPLKGKRDEKELKINNQPLLIGSRKGKGPTTKKKELSPRSSKGEEKRSEKGEGAIPACAEGNSELTGKRLCSKGSDTIFDSGKEKEGAMVSGKEKKNWSHR